MLLTNLERVQAKSLRMREKLGRMPLNNISLKVRDGIIDIKDVLSAIETKFESKLAVSLSQKTEETLGVKNG